MALLLRRLCVGRIPLILTGGACRRCCGHSAAATPPAPQLPQLKSVDVDNGIIRCFIADIFFKLERRHLENFKVLYQPLGHNGALLFATVLLLIPCGFTSFLILSGTPGLRLRPVLSVSCPPKADAPDAPESRSSRSIFDREEIIPVFGAYLPLHHTGYLVCVQAGVLADDALRVVKTPSVMREADPPFRAACSPCTVL